MTAAPIERVPGAYDVAFVTASGQAYVEQTPRPPLLSAAAADVVEPGPAEHALALRCGVDAGTRFVSTLGCDVVGVGSKGLANQTPPRLFARLAVQVVDGTHLPFGGASIGRAVGTGFVEQLEAPMLGRVLADAAAIAAADGTVAVYTRNASDGVERREQRGPAFAALRYRLSPRDPRS